MQGDISTKVSARQALLDEMEVDEGKVRGDMREDSTIRSLRDAQKDNSSNGESTPANAGDDIEMEIDDANADVEGEEDENLTPAVQTPGEESPAIATGDENEDDLFGEEQSEDMGLEENGNEGDGEEEDRGDRDEKDEVEGAENEMAALLNAELATTPDSPNMTEEQAQANAAAALNDFAMAGGLDEPAESPDPDAMREYRLGMSGVEGGVGMRRLASGLGVADDDDDESSEDSDD